MDRTVAVRASEPIDLVAPAAPSHLRLAELVHDEPDGDGPTRMFTSESSYRGPGVESTATTVSSNPAPVAPVGHSTSVIEMVDEVVREVIEGRLDLDVDALPPTHREQTVAATHVPRQPMPITSTAKVAQQVLRTPEGVAAPEGTQVVAHPVAREPAATGTQVVERPVLLHPDRGNTQPRTRLPVHTPAPAPQPMMMVPAAEASVAGGVATAACITIVGRYLIDGEPGASYQHGVGGSWVLGRSATSPFADDPYVDAEHGALCFRPDGVVVDDFDSTNGVFVRVYGHATLRSGDHFRLGEQLIRYTARRRDGGTGRAPTLGSPDPGYWGRVDVMLSVDDNAASYPIDDAEVSFGQTDGHVQFPDDPYLGELHCRIVKQERGATLEDLGAAAGTWLRLRSGDVVPYGAELLIGQTRIRVDAV